MEALDEYLEIRWNGVVSTSGLTNSKEMVYALPVTQLQKNGMRDGVGVTFMEYISRHVRFLIHKVSFHVN